MPPLAILLTPPTTVPGEASTLASLCAASTAAPRPPASIHVRKPGLSRAQLDAYVRALDLAVRARVVLHSHHELAGELGLKVWGIGRERKREREARGVPFAWRKKRVHPWPPRPPLIMSLSHSFPPRASTTRRPSARPAPSLAHRA